MEKARVFKEEGTRLFKAARYEGASAQFLKMINFTNYRMRLSGALEVARKTLLQYGHLSLARCFLKLSKKMEVLLRCGSTEVMPIWL